jgi:tetratricopeptide (TPR) repeat protein
VVAAERAGDPTRALLARVISARAAQRDPEEAASAAIELEGVAEQLAASGDDGPSGDRLLALELGAQLAIASGEQQLIALDPERARAAYDQAEGIVAEAPADALPDARFLALQGSALTAQLTRSFGRAADRLRSIVRLVSTHGAPRDELEARMGLGHMLIQLGKYDDAVRHMDLARSLAKDSGTVDERLLASQSAALAALHGKRYGRALDRAYEALEVAGLEKRSLPSYTAVVSLIAQIHLARGNPSEAYLTLLYAAASVKQRLGPQATLLFDVQIEELKRGLGPEKFDAMCEEIMRARAARERLESE